MFSKRLEALGGASVFTQMDDLRLQLQKEGKDLINLSIGSPDLPPSMDVRAVLREAALDDKAYGYTLTRGTPSFRRSCAEWYKRRFGVDLDPETEVLPLMDSQDGLAHIFWVFIDPGDTALIPDPGYPIYTAGLLLAGGKKVSVPLKEDNGFLPDLKAIDPDVARKAKILMLNYPNNPTAATASLPFFEEVVAFAKEYDIVVCHDAAYSELAYDGFRPVSFLQAPGAKEVGVEFHSVSKTYNLAGVRLGFVVGNARIIAALAELKSNIDYGVFAPVLRAGEAALNGSQQEVEINRKAYQNRRDVFIEEVKKVGWHITPPKASMFIWAKVPTNEDSLTFAMNLAKHAGVIVVPGRGFGDHGEGYVRIALVQSEEVIGEAARRIAAYLQRQD